MISPGGSPPSELLAALEDLARRVATALAPALCTVVLPQDDGTFRRVVAVHSDSDLQRASDDLLEERVLRPPPGTPGLAVLRSGEPLLISELHDGTMAAASASTTAALLRRVVRAGGSCILAAIRDGSRPLALLSAFAAHEQKWAGAEVELVHGFAQRSAALLGALREGEGAPQRELEVRLAQQSEVARLGVRALSVATADEVCADAIAVLRRSLGVGMVAVIESDGNHARVRAAAGFAVGETWNIAPGSIGELLHRTGAPLVVADLETDRRFRASHLLRNAKARSGVAVPLQRDGRMFGSLVVADLEPRRFDAHDTGFVQSVGNVIAAAIERERHDKEQRSAEERLRTLADTVAASERYYRSMLENASDLVGIIDESMKLSYVGPNVRSMFGWEPAELLGTARIDLIHPEDVRAARAALEDALSAFGRVSFARIRIRHKDGIHRWVDCVARNLVHDEAVRGIVVNCRDVTERYVAEQQLRQSEEKLRQAQKIEAVGRLAGGIAHDFNNLLTAILTTAQLASDETPEGSNLRADLEEIRGAAERAADLTRQLLAFSRRQVLRPRILDLCAELTELEKMLTRLIGEDVRLSTDKAGECTVRADPGQVQQVILNLALNARDAMPRGGTLAIRVDKVVLEQEDGPRMFGCPIARATYVRLRVSDSGVGMDEATLQRIFEPFFTTKEIGKGTGLGLATVYGIVKQSGGYIRATSALGSGSTFEVYLPECTEAPAEAQSAEAEATETPGRGETVLLVEDEEAVRTAGRKALVRAGFRVLEATNGVEALDVYAGTPIDLVVTDLVMPEMGGRELATRLRQRNPEVKVLFTSGYTDDATIRGGEMGPASSFLAKPFTPEALSRKLRELLDQRAS